ncbi:MAG: hypothetical protein R3B92_01415 [Patescibacteria group bacterium]|uniref:Uncharacterized protein n=1 Tax=candidate division WWE3 bacterium TaxID=2053526 RepID=A0A955J1E0_UNCKA|nr:hypothetical protein [candidate division WWE3 bacterium]
MTVETTYSRDPKELLIIIDYLNPTQEAEERIQQIRTTFRELYAYAYSAYAGAVQEECNTWEETPTVEDLFESLRFERVYRAKSRLAEKIGAEADFIDVLQREELKYRAYTENITHTSTAAKEVVTLAEPFFRAIASDEKALDIFGEDWEMIYTTI